MASELSCPHCSKHLRDANSLYQHMKAKHGAAAARKLDQRPEREMSLADISVEARLKQAMGEPLDALEESLIFD